MQLSFLPKKDLRFKKLFAHGGALSNGKRKIKRPLIPGSQTHLILKSSKARGPLGFFKHKNFIRQLLNERARKYMIEIGEFVNMGNHLHIKVRFNDPKRFANFLRTFTAMLARKLTGASRTKKFGKFWDSLAYTRVLTSKFEEFGLRKYFAANRIEREYGKDARIQFLKANRTRKTMQKEDLPDG